MLRGLGGFPAVAFQRITKVMAEEIVTAKFMQEWSEQQTYYRALKSAVGSIPTQVYSYKFNSSALKPRINFG